MNPATHNTQLRLVTTATLERNPQPRRTRPTLAQRMEAEGHCPGEIAATQYAIARMRGEAPVVRDFGIDGGSWTPGDAA